MGTEQRRTTTFRGATVEDHGGVEWRDGSPRVTDPAVARVAGQALSRIRSRLGSNVED